MTFETTSYGLNFETTSYELQFELTNNALRVEMFETTSCELFLSKQRVTSYKVRREKIFSTHLCALVSIVKTKIVTLIGIKWLRYLLQREKKKIEISLINGLPG